MTRWIWIAAALIAAPVGAHEQPSQSQPASPPASQAQTSQAQRPTIEPKADAVLHDMSRYLASLQSFRVQSETVDELVLKNGEKLQEIADSRVAVKRPNRLRSDRVGPVADVTFRYDGNQFSIYGKRTGMYATAPAPRDLDGAIDVARDKLGIYAPGGDLLYSDPYATLTEGVVEGRYIGLEPLDGVQCHHLAFRGQDVDWQIWVQPGPEPLPVRYVITSKHDVGQPEFVVNLSRWEPHARVADEEFAFVPPAGSTRIRFLTRGETAHR